MELHHFGIAVMDINKSVEVYKLMGFVCETDQVHDMDRNIFIVFMKNGPTRIELIQKAESNQKSPIDNIIDGKTKHSIYHTCYSVCDMDSEIETRYA